MSALGGSLSGISDIGGLSKVNGMTTPKVQSKARGQHKNKVSVIASEIAAAVDAAVQPELTSESKQPAEKQVQHQLDDLETHLEELQRQQQYLYRQQHFQLQQQRMLKQERSQQHGRIKEKIKEVQEQADMLLMLQNEQNQLSSNNSVQTSDTGLKRQQAPTIVDFTPDLVATNSNFLPKLAISCSEPLSEQAPDPNYSFRWQKIVAFVERNLTGPAENCFRVGRVDISEVKKLNPYSYRCTVPRISSAPSCRYLVIMDVRIHSSADLLGADTISGVANALQEALRCTGYGNFDSQQTQFIQSNMQVKMMTQICMEPLNFT